MSPEQANGSVDTGAPSDIYSLGILLFELLTGKIPLLGESHIDTLLKVRQDAPPNPRSINSKIPVDLESICLKCIKKSPANRYATAWELSSDLQNWLHGRAVTARRPSVAEKIGKWVKRNPAITFAILGISAGLCFAGSQWQKAQHQATRAKRNVTFAQKTIYQLLQQTSRESSLPPEVRRKFAEQAVSLQTRLIQDEPDNADVIFHTAYAWHQLAIILHDLREFQESNEAIDQAHSYLEQIPDDRRARECQTNFKIVRASNFRALGRDDEIAALFQDELSDSDSPEAKLNLATALEATAAAKRNQGELESAIMDYRQAILMREISGIEPMMIQGGNAMCNMRIGALQLELDRDQEAETTLQHALQQQLSLVAVTSFHESMEETLARIQYYLGIACNRLGKHADAIEQQAESVARFDMLRKWDVLKIRYVAQWLDSKHELVITHIQANQLEEAKVELRQLETGFENIETSVAEHFSAGLRLIDTFLELAERHQENENAGESTAMLDRADHWIDTLDAEYPDNAEIAERRDSVQARR